jgi:hypothetical protein
MGAVGNEKIVGHGISEMGLVISVLGTGNAAWRRTRKS